nr:7006_t:CDS:2 [Entrophospora candida]
MKPQPVFNNNISLTMISNYITLCLMLGCVKDLLDLYNFSDIQNSISAKSSYMRNKYSMPDFNNGDSCDVRFESIAKKLEPDLESPCDLLDKNDDVVVEDYEVDEDGLIFEEDDEYDGEGVINDQIEKIRNERLDDGDGEIEQFDVDNDDNNIYNNENEEDNNDGGDSMTVDY